MSVLLLLLFAAGCSGQTRTPSSPPPSDAQGRYVSVELHGTLHVPSPESPGPQGRLDPWLVADDLAAYDLELGPGFEALSDPAASGRGVTIQGDIAVRDPVPVGAESRRVRVKGFEFD